MESDSMSGPSPGSVSRTLARGQAQEQAQVLDPYCGGVDVRAGWLAGWLVGWLAGCLAG